MPNVKYGQYQDMTCVNDSANNLVITFQKVAKFTGMFRQAWLHLTNLQKALFEYVYPVNDAFNNTVS